MSLFSSLLFVVALSETEVAEGINSFSRMMRFYYQLTPNLMLSYWLLYLTIIPLAVLVYKLGFAQKLPLLKSALIYFFLIVGCLVLTILGVFLPIVEGLVVASLILIIYKIRLNRERKKGLV